MPFSKKFDFLSLSRIDLISEQIDPVKEKTNYELNKELNTKINELRHSPLPEEYLSEEKSATKRLMETIKKKNRYEFILELNVVILQLNDLIDHYNGSASADVKIKLLNEIDQKQSNLDRKYPDSVYASCPEYREAFYDHLVPDIKRQRERLAQLSSPASPISILKSSSVASFTDDSVFANTPDIHSPTPLFSPNLPELIDRMSPEKVSKLMELLSSIDESNINEYRDKLNELYGVEDPDYAEFQRFLQDHVISYLGGHHSSNFKVVNTVRDGSPFVLKIEDRLNQPKEIAHLLYETNAELLNQDIISRRGTFSSIQNRLVTRNLVVNEYCEGNSLLEKAKNICSKSERINHALKIYKEMGDALLSLQKQHVVFTDMKNSNWGFKADKLIILDNKSIRHANEDGYLDMFTDKTKWYGGAIISPEMCPPEINQEQPILVDKMHAFMWGKNLYNYLTEGKFENPATEGTDLTFNFPVFKTRKGMLCEQLIKDTVKPDVNSRLSMQEAMDQLEKISIVHQRIRDYQQQIQALSHTIDPSQASVTAFFSALLHSSKTWPDYNRLEAALLDHAEFIKTDPEFQDYKACYDKFTDIRAFFAHHPDMNSKILQDLQSDFDHYNRSNIEQIKADLQSISDDIAEYNKSQQQMLKAAVIEIKKEQQDEIPAATVMELKS